MSRHVMGVNYQTNTLIESKLDWGNNMFLQNKKNQLTIPVFV